MMTVHSIKIRTRWTSATTAKITPATRANVFASMSHHPKFLTQDSTQAGGGCETSSERHYPEGCANPPRGLQAAWRQAHRHAPHRCRSEGAYRANSAEHRRAFRANG